MEIGDFLHFRVHTDELDIEQLLTFLNGQCHIDFAVKEYGKGNREHIHACIKLKVAKQTFVDRLKKKFPVINGNKYYGLGKIRKDYDTNARYCYKGTASDYPDILQTVHAETTWKSYYKSYWDIFKELHTPKEIKVLGQIPEPKKIKTKTFTLKLLDEILEDFNPIVSAIWYYKGYKQDPKNPPPLTYEETQNWLADLLLQRLGKAAKAIDKYIFERMYRGIWTGILATCPKNITKEPAIHLLDNFRCQL